MRRSSLWVSVEDFARGVRRVERRRGLRVFVRNELRRDEVLSADEVDSSSEVVRWWWVCGGDRVGGPLLGLWSALLVVCRRPLGLLYWLQEPSVGTLMETSPQRECSGFGGSCLRKGCSGLLDMPAIVEVFGQ